MIQLVARRAMHPRDRADGKRVLGAMAAIMLQRRGIKTLVLSLELDDTYRYACFAPTAGK